MKAGLLFMAYGLMMFLASLYVDLWFLGIIAGVMFCVGYTKSHFNYWYLTRDKYEKN